MNTPARLALGVASTLPALATTFLALRGPTLLHTADEALVQRVVVVAGLAIFTGFAVMFVFLLRALRMPGKRFGWRLGWTVALTGLTTLAAPVFWYLHVWRRHAA